MNERIKNLAIQSGITRILNEHAHEYGNGMFENTPYPELEKFAELIVRECVNQALEEKVSEEEIDKEDDIEDRCYLRGNNGGIVDAVIRIKEHFGVEE